MEKVTKGANPLPGRNHSVHKKRVIEAFKKRVKRRSMRKMAKNLHILDRLLRRRVKEDLGLKP